MSNNFKTTSIILFFAIMSAMSVAVQAQIGDIPYKNYKAREYIDSITSPIPMPQPVFTDSFDAPIFSMPDTTLQSQSIVGPSFPQAPQQFIAPQPQMPQPLTMPQVQMPQQLTVPQMPLTAPYSTIPNENLQFIHYINTVVAPPLQITNGFQCNTPASPNNTPNGWQQPNVVPQQSIPSVPSDSLRMTPHPRTKSDWVVGPRTMNYEDRREYLKVVHNIYP